MPKKQLRPIVEVEWVDSIFHSGWTQLDAMTKSVEGEPMLHRTAGYLFKSTKAYIAVVQSSGDSTDSVDAVMQIPRSAVRSIRKFQR